MSQSAVSMPGGTRLESVFVDLVKELRGFIRSREISYDEYHQAIGFLAEAGAAGELPLLLDVFLETMVDEVNNGNRPGTASCLAGPFYVPGAPLLEPPFALPQREGEPGDTLLFSGSVRSIKGTPLAGATLDLWQANGAGQYSHFDYQEPAFNLRGRLRTDAGGRFAVRTVVPKGYEIPKAGPTGKLLAALGRHAWRPGHLHVRVTHEGFHALTTQLYMAGDPWIDSDVVGAVKSSLVVTLDKNPAANGPLFTLGYDFSLAPLAA